jgi:hypothetical protein
VRVQLDAVVVTAIEVGLPEMCPRCGADFTEGDSLAEQQLCFGSQLCSIVGAVVDGYGESRSGDCAFVTGFCCAACRENVAVMSIDERPEPASKGRG